MATTTVPVEDSTIRMYKADSATIRCSVVKASDGSVMDLTSYTAKLSVKREQYDNDADALFILSGTISSPTTGVCTFAVTTANSDQRPGTYYYDIQVVNGTTIKTVAAGKFIIQWDVTRATS
jgi:hypothetical protein